MIPFVGTQGSRHLAHPMTLITTKISILGVADTATPAPGLPHFARATLLRVTGATLLLYRVPRGQPREAPSSSQRPPARRFSPSTHLHSGIPAASRDPAQPSSDLTLAAQIHDRPREISTNGHRYDLISGAHWVHLS